MIRRALLLAACLSVTTVAAGTAFAAGSATSPSDTRKGEHSLCVGTSKNPNDLDGVCVWVPTN